MMASPTVRRFETMIHLGIKMLGRSPDFRDGSFRVEYYRFGKEPFSTAYIRRPGLTGIYGFLQRGAVTAVRRYFPNSGNVTRYTSSIVAISTPLGSL